MISIRLTETGTVSPEQGGYGNLLVPGIFSLLLMLSIIFSSAYLIQSLGDEKENRLIEVLVSSVSVRELLIGKVLGLGAAGLVQVLVWVISTPLLLGLASSSIGGFLKTLQVPPNFYILCVVYFILGYLLFAMISMAIGAISLFRPGRAAACHHLYPPRHCAALVLLGHHAFPQQPGLGGPHHFPHHRPGNADVKARLDGRRPPGR